MYQNFIYFSYWGSDISVTILHVRSFMTAIDQFSYRKRVIMNDFIDIGDYITCLEFYDSYWSIWFIDDLEDGYIDDFEDMSWLYTLPRLFYSWQLVITHPEYLDLPEKTGLIILGIYLITILSMLPLITGKRLLHGNNTFMLYLLHIPVIPVSCSLLLYIPVIPVSWLHMLILLLWLPPSYPSDSSNMHIK